MESYQSASILMQNPPSKRVPKKNLQESVLKLGENQPIPFPRIHKYNNKKEKRKRKRKEKRKKKPVYPSVEKSQGNTKKPQKTK